MKIEETLKNFRDQAQFMEDRINLGIEQNRKGYFKVNIMNKDGSPVNSAKITVRQKSHEFKFGCNIFKLGCFESDADNAAYEECFANLFNMATLPFYWDNFEPEKGKMRFDKDSVFIDRRIPPEQALEFCRKHNIEAKGHPLFWQVTMPDWLPNDYEAMKEYWIDRLEAISRRYDGVIKSFDCINEVTSVPFYDCEPTDHSYRNHCPLDYEYPYYAFDRTAAFFKKSRLVLNDTASPWEKNNFKGECSHYYLLAKDLIRSGARVDVLGLQFHAFKDEEHIHEYNEDLFNPRSLYRVLDLYSKLQRPMSISEITIPGYDDDMQAEIIRDLYRIWFSSPNMESIIYWNLGDHCAAATDGWTEDLYKSGLVRSDFSKKPSYYALENLIKHEWHTDLDLETADDHIWFKAFYGDYDVTVIHDGKEVTRELKLSKHGFSEFNFIF